MSSSQFLRDTGTRLTPANGDTEAESAKILARAQKRYDRAKKWENMFRSNFRDDIRFEAGDVYNGYQWTNDIRKSRERDKRPCLTINRTRQHNLQIINSMLQNPTSILIRPTGNDATYEAAQCLQNIVRQIEYHSQAQLAYKIARQFLVKGGYGVVRVRVDWKSVDSFEQEIYIDPVDDPMSVLFDSDARKPDKSDSNWAFVFDDVNIDEFDDVYPELEDRAKSQLKSRPVSAALNTDGWITAETIRVAEYFYIDTVDDTLLQIQLKSGPIIVRESALTPELISYARKDSRTRERKIRVPTVMWALICGNETVETAEIPCKYIPLIPMIGEETVIDGTMDRRGHTRALIDPQRMYNYWTSSAVEQVALQSKSPWVAPAEAIEGHERYWNTANKENHSVLPYNALDDEGNTIPAPTKNNPPEMAQAFLQGMQVTQNELMMVSGQFESNMGEQGNERTGAAINAKQNIGDNATYHYVDADAIAIAQVGRIVLDMIPRVYDTTRVVHAQGEDGVPFEVHIDPSAQQAYEQHLNEANEVAKRVLNPAVGEYEVQATPGPTWGTRRQQAFDALIQIITQAPNLANVIGDLLLTSADFPMAKEAAERIKRTIPPEVLGNGPTPQVQALTQQMQQMQQALSKVWQQYVELKIKTTGKDQLRDVNVYDAETRRIAALGKMIPESDPQGGQDMVRQLVQDTLSTHIMPLVQSLTKKLDSGEPIDSDILSHVLSMATQGQNSAPTIDGASG